MRLFFTLILSISFLMINAQITVDFESNGLEVDTFLNGSDLQGGFSNDFIFLPNSYNEQYGSWIGWAISTKTDTETQGWANQYSAIPGAGFYGSQHYAVSYVSGSSRLVMNQDEPVAVSSFYVTNNAYAYYSMLNGDSYAKKFGGEDGTDPDFFLLTVKGYKNGELTQDSVDFYLADFRSDNSADDYIVNDWQLVDVSDLGAVDSLNFQLSSSDNGQYGMNTPAYFCMDNVFAPELVNTNSTLVEDLFTVYPNPTANFCQINTESTKTLDVKVYDVQGRVLIQDKCTNSSRLDLTNLVAGSYVIIAQNEEVYSSKIIIKE